MKIAYIGKFQKLHDEEYIARSFEYLGHTVNRIPDNMGLQAMFERILQDRPDFVLFAKLNTPETGHAFLKRLKQENIPTVCWLFDLYFDYVREDWVQASPCFKADYVFTTDGGHDDRWKRLGINHHTVRQGIWREACVLAMLDNPHGVALVGSANPTYPPRVAQVDIVRNYFQDFRWFGKKNTDEVRGFDLNRLYATVKVLIGDSVYSPHYWSNRVVETLGRGGFLIHVDVPGLKEAYPNLVTYQRGNVEDMVAKIRYYLEHEKERQAIIKKNFTLVQKKYTMDKRCAELLSYL